MTAEQRDALIVIGVDAAGEHHLRRGAAQRLGGGVDETIEIGAVERDDDAEDVADRLVVPCLAIIAASTKRCRSGWSTFTMPKMQQKVELYLDGASLMRGRGKGGRTLGP